MWFWVYSEKGKPPATYPIVVLVRDNWDDYGYRTTFRANLHLTKSDSIDLGNVKIMHSDQQGGSTDMPSDPFRKLNRKYASLGGDLGYYEKLYTLGSAAFESYFKALRDVAFDDEVKAHFEDHEGFRVSLLRFSGAERTISDAAKLLRSKSIPTRKRRSGFKVKFKTRIAPTSNPVVIALDFQRRGRLPNRLNAIIGYNGTGKTRLLSNLAIVASGYGYDSKEDVLSRSAGRFVGTKPRFKTVIVVSYSAFDTFVIPGRTLEEKKRITNEGEIFGYVYCGLRERVEDSLGAEEGSYRLLTSSEIERDFQSALGRVRERDRLEALLDILRPLMHDPSFQKIGLTQLFALRDEDESAKLFRTLSSGHKVVLKIVAELSAHINGTEPTLVLLDEPETHLHPPLLAAFLKSVRACLDEYDGYAVIATHSPVVLQETPARYVHVLRRVSEFSQVETTSIETFAEGIGVITQEVFNLGDGTTDWHDTLLELGSRHDLDLIEKMFGRRLGFAARSYLLSVRNEVDD